MNNILFEKNPSIKYQATPEAQSRFNTYVDNIDTVKLRYKDNELARKANVANAICELSPDYKGMFDISPDAAFASFFGLEESKSIDTMESVLKQIRKTTKDSEDALAEFKKLNREEQDRIVKKHSSNAKKEETIVGIYGIPSLVKVDNPNYDSEKERAKYEEKLKAKNTWESYLNIRNNFSTEVVSDAMRFVQASNDRSEAAYAHIDKFLAKDFDYKEQFLSAIHAFNPEIRAGFIERVKTRIGEGWTDSGRNLKDYFVERNKDSRILHGLAEEMGLVDKDGNLTANDNQLAELQKAYETKQNVALNRSMGAMGGMGMNNSVYQNTDVKKLFDEGKKAFERTKTIRMFLDANRTKFSYDKGEWQTFENALVNGEYALRSLLIGFGATALTKNAYAGVVATMPMMYAEEASSMYADLRFNKNIKESDAIAGALFYGTTSTLLEQLQFSRFSKFFTKGSFIPETFKQYLAHGVKEASLRLGKETAIETFVEFGQASLGFATKAWAKNHTDDFELRPLWDEYCAEVSEVFKTMPIITSLMFGVGAPFRARGYLKNVGADFGSAIKGVYKSSDVLNNNVKAKGTIDLANQYFEDVKSKLGNTASGREWLGKYFSATTEEEKTKLLNERYTDNNERYEAKMMLDQLADIDSKATQEWVKIKVEAAKKRADEANKILRGDTTDISLFDNEIVDEKGNRSYEVLESAIDALNMRSVVASVNTAQELSEIAGVSLQEAEEIMSRKGAKGFFDEKDGKIIVINPHFKNGVDALQSFVHEYGHKIMKHIRETDANGYKRMCENVLTLVGGEDFARSLLPASYSQEGHTNYEATAQGIAEETLMRVIEQVAYKKVLDTKKRSVWEHFKGWFGKFFDEKSLADITNEQLAEMALDVLQREKTFDVSLSSKPSKKWRAKTPEADGAEVSGEWSVMDASELLASTDKGYDDALQPRNRSRQSSKEQVLSIANNLDPERLDNDPTTSDGAPIIDDRNMVVSGNGRILAIRQAYEFGKADEYRRHVQNRAKAMGVDIPKNIKNPVLVRKVNNTGEMSIEELAARSNKSSVAGMSVAEQAVADGRRIIEHNLLEIFYPSADGNILAESNRDFNNAFLDMVGGGELYRNKDGSLRANLAPRVKAGVLAAMLNNDGNRDIVERLLDNPEGYSALINGLMQCAANVAELTQKPMYDISGDLSQAVELYIEMHDKGQTVAEFSAQMDMFREKPSDEVMFLCKLFEDNQRTSSGISGVLKEYASQCKKIDTTTASLFGEDDPSKFDKLQSAYNHYATDIANQDTGANLKAKEVEETTQKKFNASYNIKDRRVYFYDRKDIPDLMLYNIQNKLTLHSEKDKPILKDEEKDNLRQNTKIIIEKLKAQTGPNIIEELFDIDDRTINAIKSFYDYYNLDNPIKDGKHFITKEIFSHSKKHQELQGFNDEVLLIEEDFYLIGEILKSWDYISFRRRKTTNTITFEKIYDDVVVFLTEEIRTGRRQQGQNKLAVLTIYKREELASRGSNDTTNLINEHRHPNSSDTTQSENNTGSQQNSSLKAKYDETRSQEELDALNAKFKDLYEQHKNSSGFERLTTFKQALDLVKAEAERKGYTVKVYHGTGADGFNVAKADSSEEQNGEGNQAHGAGLYMAVSRDVAEGYKDSAIDKAKYEMLSHLKIKGLPLSDILNWKILIDENQEVLKIMFSEMVNTPYIFSFDEYIEIQNDWIKKSNNDYDRAVHNQAKKAIEIIKKAFKEKGIRTDDVSITDVEGHIFNWFTNLNEDNTLDEQLPFSEQSKAIQDKLKKAVYALTDEQLGGLSKDDVWKDFAVADSNGGLIYDNFVNFTGSKLEASQHLLKHGIKGLTYGGRQDGRCYVSFEGGATVKLQDPFTFDDNGELIPLTERFNEDNPDMRWKFDDEMPSPEDIIEAKRQYDEIVAKYKGTPLWMKAPNGQPTKLTERQWVMVRTPNFKKWFGDWENDPQDASKVVDENGEPLVVYHGTSAEFTTFKKGRDAGMHFGTLEQATNRSSRNIMPVFLNIRNPKRTHDKMDGQAFEIKKAKKSKFDGLVYRNIFEGEGDSYVAFKPNQIKSATDNVGTFSQSNDIRWKVDTVLMPIDINLLVAQNIDALMNAIRKSHKPILSKKAELEKKYSQDDKDRKSKIQNDLRLFILENFSSELVPIAKLSDKDFKFYRKQFGLRDRFVYTSFGYAIEHFFNRHPETPIENYLLLPDTIINPDKKKEVGRWVKDEWGQPLYEASEAFIKEYDKWHVSTIKVDTQLTSSGKKLVAFKNFYEDSKKSKEPYKNKKTIEDFWKNALSSSDSSRRYANISHAQKSQSSNIPSSKKIESQGENSTRLKALLRQERSENPVIWASIVLAKEILRGRAITGAKLEKVLPSGKFDGTQRQYAVDRAKLIAEQCKATQEGYINRLDQAVKLAENDVYWTRDIVQEMNNSFRRDGEEYGIVRQKLTQWLKDEQRKGLEKVKGLTSSELGIDVAEAIENALEAEPERKKSESSVEEETEEEVSDDVEEGVDNELVGAVEKLAPSNIREIISKVRIGVLKAVKAKGGDEQTRRRVYRNTLVEVLREATKQLTYGKEREAIFAKISELATKGYAVIKIKDGERAGQKIDNYTLRAEHIALRIFNRGVRDTKEALLEKFEKLLKHAKAPARIKRDDKRKMTGKSEERAYIIKQIAYMPLNSDDKTVKSVESEIENTLAVINKADSSMANDYHAKLINAVQYLEDLQRFGALKEKSRAEMAEAIEWIEKFLEDETQSHAEKVEKLKEDADRRRKIFLDAINENDHNANFDGKVRESFRYLLNSGSTFKDLLLGLGRSATGEKSSKFRQLVNDMMNDCYRATAEKENEVFKFQNELTEVVKEIYGMNASDAFKHLLGSNEKLQEFSIQGKPMSVQIALQRLSMAEQRNYEHNVYIHCCGRSKEAKAIEQRIDELEQQKAETTDFEVLKQIRADIKKLENELETIERNSVAEYVEKLRSALSEQDLKLLSWFREFYSREREHLSDANEVITGLGVPEADPLYTPMKMLREGGTNEKHQVVAIVPKSLSPRVPNALDMDENIGIVDIWNERIAENAQYKAFSQLNIEWRGIFAHADFHKAVNTKLGKNVLTQVLDHFNDIMSVSVLGGLTIDSIDKLNGLYAIAALGFNLGSGLRQMTGASAFANFVGAKNTFKYAKDCLSKEGRQASIEILKSDIAKRRMQSGNNQVLLEALNNIEDNKFWAWYKRNAMFFNRWGDILPILTIGQGIYRSKTEEYANSMSIEEAKEKAMNEMWAIAEASQQSPSVMNMGTWQRRGGSFGKAAGLFISSPQLMLSREVEVFNRFVSVRKKYKKNPNDDVIRKDYTEARKALAKTFFINHVLVQGGYMVATALWKALLGDDWDDDDCWAILAETIAGPLGGLVVFGRFVSAFYSNYSVSAMPIEGFGRTVKASVDLVQDLIMLDGEEITKDLDRIAKSLFAPYRDASKIYKNATDDKDGLVW